MLTNPNSRSIINDLNVLVEFETFDMLQKQKNPSFKNVFNSLIRQGVEVDIQTATYLYENVTAPLRSKYFTGVAELAEIRGATIQQIMDKKVAVVRRNQIGKDSPVVAAVASLAQTVQQDMRALPTTQKIIQERLKKAAARALELKGKVHKGLTAWEALSQAMEVDRSDNKFRNSTNRNIAMGYLANAETVWDEFRKEMEEVATEMEVNDSMGAAEMRNYADMLSTHAYDLLLSSREVKDIIVESLKDAGYTKMTGVNGQDKMVVDWNKVNEAGFDFNQTVRDALDRQGYSIAQVNKIAPFLEREYDKMVKTKLEKNIGVVATSATKNDMDRLARLAVIGAFQKAEKQIVYQALGVDELKQEQMDAVYEMMIKYNEFMKAGLSNLSPSYFNTIAREIRNLIERTQEGQHVGLAIVRRYQLMSQFSSASLLLNVGNALVENTTSGLAEMINTAIINPRWILKTGKSWVNTLADVVQGGVRQGHEKANINDQRVNIDDRTSFEQADTVQKKVFAFANIFSRTLLTGIDASAKAYLWKSMEVNAIRMVLQSQGLTKDEALSVINETYFKNTADIEATAKEMEQNLREMGLNVAKGKWRRIAGELALANVNTDGKYFNDVLVNLEAEGKLRAGVGEKLSMDENLLLSIRKAANNAAARGLGHSSDLWLMSLMDRTIEMTNKGIQNNKSLGKKAIFEGVQATVGNIMRFRSGMLKWFALNIQKSSGMMLVTTLLVDGLIMKRGKLLKKENLAKRIEQLDRTKFDKMVYEKALSEFTTDYESALAYRQRLSRSIIQPAISFILWKYAIAPAVDNLFKNKCDSGDSKTECLQKKMIYLKENGWDNWVNKLMPIAVQDYVNTLVVHRPTSTDYYNFKKNPNAFNGMMESYFSTFNPTSEKDFERTVTSVINNAGEDPIFSLVEDMKSASRYKDADERRDVIIGKFVGRTLNLGGPLKMYDINKRYFNGIRGIKNVESSSEYNKNRPDDVLEAVIMENLTKDLYREYLNETRE